METKSDYYWSCLEKAWKYQDFICIHLQPKGIVVQNIQSKKFQGYGENLLGLEIKFDNQIQEYGNVYIETNEKVRVEDAHWIPSGILRDDNSWLYGIGDYSHFWIFSKRTLRAIHNKRPNWIEFREAKVGTSLGFVMKVEKATEMAERYFEFSSNN